VDRRKYQGKQHPSGV
jgi:hypothetical protein